jgi:hypothetical protein
MRLMTIALATALVAGGGLALAKRDTAPPAAVSTGAPVSCIPLSQIRESRVRSDTVIDFRTGGKKWYRNTLSHSCPSLGFEEKFSYTTSLSQLCSTDIIYVLHNYGSGLQKGAGCGLGKFEPVELVKPAKAP